jgi:hypothetical protein
MALATQADVEAILGRPLTPEEAARVESQLEEASDLVVGYLHPCPLPTPTPTAIVRVVASMVAALIKNPTPATVPSGATTLGAGPYNVGFSEGATSPGPWLTAKHKMRLRPFRCGNGMTSVGLSGERTI